MSTTTQPAPEQADATKAITTLRKRLSRWELDHLRTHCAELAERLETAQQRIDALEADNDRAWRTAESWREETMQLINELQDKGQEIGLTQSGHLVALDKPSGNSTAAAVTALQRRAHLGIVAAAAANNPYNLRYWQGCAATAADMLNGRADQMAAKDAAEADAAAADGSANQVQTGLQAAVAALPKGAERLSMAEVQQILTAQGIEIASDLVAQLDVSTGEVFKHRELPGIVHPHDEHAAPGVDVRHCACGHGADLIKNEQASIVRGAEVAA